MRTISQEELEWTLKYHEMWLKDFRKGTRADLRNTDLSLKTLRGYNLDGANLEGACLCYSNLYGATLTDANLKGADLSYANLATADLNRADLRGAKIIDANLRRADLRIADLRGAHLKGSDLEGADLHHARLDTIERPRLGMILHAPIKGYKFCQGSVLVELTIPKGAVVFSINNVKCRTNEAIVTKIHGADRAYSTFKQFSYYVGDRINIKNFNFEYNNECAEGIHFFKTLEEANDYWEL